MHNAELKCHRKGTLTDLDRGEWKILKLILEKCHKVVKLMELA